MGFLLPLLEVLAPILGIGAADATTLAGLTVVAPALAGGAGAGLGALGTAGLLGAGGLAGLGASGALGGAGGGISGGVQEAINNGWTGTTDAQGLPIVGNPTPVAPIEVTAPAGGAGGLDAGAAGGGLVGGAGTDVLGQVLGQQPPPAQTPSQPAANQPDPNGTTEYWGRQVPNTAQGADGVTYTYDPATGGYVGPDGLPMGAGGGGTTVGGVSVTAPALTSPAITPLGGVATGAGLSTDLSSLLGNANATNVSGVESVYQKPTGLQGLDVTVPGATGLSGLDVAANPYAGISPFVAPLIPALFNNTPNLKFQQPGKNPNFPSFPQGGGQQVAQGGGGASAPKPVGTPFGGSGAGIGAGGGIPAGISGSTKPKIFPWVTPDQGAQEA